MALTITKGQTQPTLEHTVTRDGVAVDLTGATVDFKMRAVGDDTLVVDASAVVVSAATGGVEYRWQTADTATTGDFLGWWEVTLPSTDPVDTVEVLIQVRDHASAWSGLCTLEEVKAADPTGQAVGHLDDERILQLIQAVTAGVLEDTGRDFVDRGEANPRAQLVPIIGATGIVWTPDLASAPTLVEAVADISLTEAPTAMTSADWAAWPMLRRASQPITGIRLLTATSAVALLVTGTWGWPTIPSDIRDAAVETVIHRLRGRRALTSQSPDQSEYGVDTPQRLWPLAARQVFQRYQRPGIA